MTTLACCAVAISATAQAAMAHGEATPLIRGVIDQQPAVPGLEVRTVRGPAALMWIKNTSGKAIEVVSIDRIPFIRIGPGGVHANVAARAWYESGNPDGFANGRMKNGPKPLWRLVSREPEWSYFEHRLHPREAVLPKEAQGSDRPVRLNDFVVPLRYDGRPVRIRGHLEWRPVVGNPTPRIEDGARPFPGVTLTALGGRFPGVYLSNTSDRPVTVIGEDGEPFVRVGPDGAHVNTRSPLYVDNLRYSGRLPRTAADPAAPPKWLKVSGAPSYTWPEPRIRYQPEQPPDSVIRRGRTRLLEWTLPVESAGRKVDVRGGTDWIPVDAAGIPLSARGGGSGTWLLLAGLALALLVLFAAIVLRLRRARDANGAPPEPIAMRHRADDEEDEMPAQTERRTSVLV